MAKIVSTLAMVIAIPTLSKEKPDSSQAETEISRIYCAGLMYNQTCFTGSLGLGSPFQGLALYLNLIMPNPYTLLCSEPS